MSTEEEYEELLVQIQEELEKFSATRTKLEEGSKRNLEVLSAINADMKTKITEHQFQMMFNKRRTEILEYVDQKLMELATSFASKRDILRERERNFELEKKLQHHQGELSDIQKYILLIDEQAKKINNFGILVMVSFFVSATSLVVALLVLIYL
jgi:hypothetical protein